MSATGYQDSSSSSLSSSSSSSFHSSFRFSLSSRRRGQIHSMEPTTNEAAVQETELEAFQRQVAARFHDLANSDSDELLSIRWIRKLLDTFLCCQEEFRVIIFNNKSILNKPPMYRYIYDYFERSIKALDVCNAIRDGIEQIRQWQKLLEIVLCALNSERSLSEGQFRRAKKALIDLALAMIDEKESETTNAGAFRNRSFGRHQQKELKSCHFRSLSWSVSRSWSAAKQLQALSSNLLGPRPNEIVSTNGLNVAVFTMNYVLLFVMWALVAAIPCQDRGLQTNFYVARQYVWAGPILSLHERILEESKRRDRRNACGLLREIRGIERCARIMNDVADWVRHFPLTEEKENEVRSRVREVGLVYEGIKEGLDPLERLVREVFHRIVRIRNDGLDSLGRVNSCG